MGCPFPEGRMEGAIPVCEGITNRRGPKAGKSPKTRKRDFLVFGDLFMDWNQRFRILSAKGARSMLALGMLEPRRGVR